MDRYKIIIILVLMLILANYLPAKYPEKNIRVIVHVPPGGGTDSMTRLLLKFVGEQLNTNFIIENYKGAGGQVGYTILAHSIPDGYVIGTITTASVITHELIRKNVRYSLDSSFIPIARVVHDPAGLFVKAESEYKTISDLLIKAQKHPNQINCGGTSLWGTHHLHCVLIENECGAILNYIPFDGGAEVRNYLLGGHIDVAAGGASEFTSLVQSGVVRPLVIAASERHVLYPDTPTYKELGINLIIGSDRGFAAPQGTPEDIIDILSDAINYSLHNKAFLNRAEKLSIGFILDFLDADDFKEYLLQLQSNIRQQIIVGEYE